MSEPVLLRDLLPGALVALRTPHLRRLDVRGAEAPPAPARPADLSQVLVRIDAAQRRAA